MKQLIRKIVCYSSQEVGNTVLWEAPRGSTNVGQEAKEKEKLWGRAFMVVSQEAMGEIV